MLSCMSCFYILEINPLSVVSIAITFSHSVGCLSILFMISFTVQSLSLIRSPFVYFCFYFCLFIFVFVLFLFYSKLLLLLSCFSRVQLCVTPEMAAHQASLSLGFSRQEHWSGLPFTSPMHESEKWKWSRSVGPTLTDPMDCSLPGSSIHGISQATVLEWGAIAFSPKQCYKAKNGKRLTETIHQRR